MAKKNIEFDIKQSILKRHRLNWQMRLISLTRMRLYNMYWGNMINNTIDKMVETLGYDIELHRMKKKE